MSRIGSTSRKTLTLGVVALLVPAALLFAGARSGAGLGSFGGGGFHSHGALLQRVAEKLDLTDSQKSDIREIFKAHKPELRDEMEKVRAARQEQLAAIHAETFDEGAIRGAAAKLAASEADLAVTRGKIASEVRQILTPEQRVKAKELLSDAQALGNEMFQRFHQRFEEAPFGGDS